MKKITCVIDGKPVTNPRMFKVRTCSADCNKIIKCMTYLPGKPGYYIIDKNGHKLAEKLGVKINTPWETKS